MDWTTIEREERERKCANVIIEIIYCVFLKNLPFAADFFVGLVNFHVHCTNIIVLFKQN